VASLVEAVEEARGGISGESVPAPVADGDRWGAPVTAVLSQAGPGEGGAVDRRLSQPEG
jgi:hypothetical protein